MGLKAEHPSHIDPGVNAWAKGKYQNETAIVLPSFAVLLRYLILFSKLLDLITSDDTSLTVCDSLDDSVF